MEKAGLEEQLRLVRTQVVMGKADLEEQLRQETVAQGFGRRQLSDEGVAAEHEFPDKASQGNLTGDYTEDYTEVCPACNGQHSFTNKGVLLYRT